MEKQTIDVSACYIFYFSKTTKTISIIKMQSTANVLQTGVEMTAEKYSFSIRINNRKQERLIG